MRSSWPTPAALGAALSLPAGVRLGWIEPNEVATLPAVLVGWYPTISVGAESIFLDTAFLTLHAAHGERDASDFWMCGIWQDEELVGFQAFERSLASRTLHGRLGVLSPEARAGFLGATGFLLFEALGLAIEAESLQVYVTLASMGQQRFAERRGFRLAGLVPGFDRDALPDGTVRRVMEALYVKSLIPEEALLWPTEDVLTPRTRAAFQALFPERGEVEK